MRQFVSVVFCVGISIFTFAQKASSRDKPIWAKQATVLDLSCSPQEQLIASPNHRSLLQVVCNKHGHDDPSYAIRLITSDNHHYELPLNEGSHELLWAPNSAAFFVDGGTTAHAGFFMTVYRFDPLSGLRKETITDTAQEDTVKRFPPCEAYNADEKTCDAIAKNPEYKISGLAWRADSAGIYVFAEIPCSSSYGGIMCQTLGYELSVFGGRIVARLSASQTKQRWAQYAAWDIRIPDAPEYGPHHVTR
jgi:hypothetical protein